MGTQEQKNLKKARQKLNLTQAQVAKKLDMHTNYYARIERGVDTPAMKTLKEIYKILNLKWPFS